MSTVEKLACPINPTHDRFFARFQESVCAIVDADGNRGEDLSNTYEGEGQISATWCYDCDRTDDVVTIVEPLEAPKPVEIVVVLDKQMLAGLHVALKDAHDLGHHFAMAQINRIIALGEPSR